VDTTRHVSSAQHTLTISSAASELGVSVHYLRLGERLGTLPLARRTPGGQRRYSLKDIEELRRLGVGERQRWIAERNA